MLKNNIRHKFESILVIGILICSSFILLIFTNSLSNFSQASSSWDQTSYDDFDNGTFDNLTIIGSGDNAKLEINLSEIQTWLKKSPTNRPVGRYEHAMAPISGTDKILLFGGYTLPGGYKILDDTWVYDLSNNTWNQKSPTKKPSARQGHRMASISNDDKVILFGGSSSWNITFDDIWVYDLSDDKWTKKTSGPKGRYGHSMCTINGDDKVILFGGMRWDDLVYTYFDDLWEYDLSEDSWTSKSTGPTGRLNHAMASVDGDDTYVLYSGYGLGGWLNDTWIYDYGDDIWTMKIPKNNPGIRTGHDMARIWGTDNILLFGGRGQSYDNETWLYDLSKNTWTKKMSKYKPSIRDYHKMAFIYGEEKVVLFGGYYYDFPNFYNYDDTWVYQHNLPTRNGTFVSSTYDCKSKSSFKELQWYAVTPKNTSVKFQLRTANNESNLDLKDFIGPDGTITTFYNSSPSNIWSGHDGDRWVQYKVYLNLSVYTDSPSVKDVIITYNCLPETTAVSPMNGSILTINRPTFDWTFEDYDSEHQKAFQVIIDHDINFYNITYDSSEQVTAQHRWKFPSGTNYTMLPDGTWYWKVRTKDADDLWTEFTSPRQLIIDTHTPSSAPVIPVHEGCYNNLTLISGIANDGKFGSGISQIKIAIKNINHNKYWSGSDWANFDTWLDASGTNHWTYDPDEIIWTSGYRYSIQSRAIDNANNMEVPIATNYFRMDMDSPTSIIDTPKNNVYLNNLDKITGTSMDISGSGLKKVEINIKCLQDDNFWDDAQNTNKTWDGKRWSPNEHWLPVTAIEEWSLETNNIPWSTSNQYLIRSRAADNSDNIETPSSGNVFFFDNQPPEKLSIVINNDEKYTNTIEVILSLKGEDFGFGNSDMSFSTDGSKWSNWEPFNSTKLFNLPEGDSDKSVYFRTRDFAQNIAKPVHDEIVLDTTPPEDLTLNINDDAKYTNSIYVGLNLHATDALSGLSQMSFSNDNLVWDPWEPFKYTRSFSLPVGPGEKKVYFRIKDNANNNAIPVYNSIILDSIPPHSLSISINKDALETNSTEVNLRLDAHDDSSGIGRMSFSFDGESWTAWETFKNKKSLSLIPNDGEKTVYFRVVDNAGNIADPVSATILLNTTLPQIEDTTDKKASNDQDIFLILSIFIIITLIIISIAMVLVIKRRKRYVQELLQPGTIKIKPGGLLLPSVSVDEISSALKSTELPSIISPVKTQQTIAAPAQVPQLPAHEAQANIEQPLQSPQPQIPQPTQQKVTTTSSDPEPSQPLAQDTISVQDNSK